VAGNIIHQIIGGPVERYTPSLGLKGSILFQEIVNLVFLGMNQKQRSRDGRGGGAQRPLWRVNEPIATGARSSRRARSAKSH
jgi:hypothetical protein